MTMPVTLAKRKSAVNEARFRIICVPMAKVIESGPDRVACSMTLLEISSIAWSQEIRCQRPSPRWPTRFIGYSTRCLPYMYLEWRMPFWQPRGP